MAILASQCNLFYKGSPARNSYKNNTQIWDNVNYWQADESTFVAVKEEKAKVPSYYQNNIRVSYTTYNDIGICNGHNTTSESQQLMMEGLTKIQDKCAVHTSNNNYTLDLFYTIGDGIIEYSDIKSLYLTAKQIVEKHASLVNVIDENNIKGQYIRCNELNEINRELCNILTKVGKTCKNNNISENSIIKQSDLSYLSSNIESYKTDCNCYTDCNSYSLCYCYGNCYYY